MLTILSLVHIQFGFLGRILNVIKRLFSSRQAGFMTHQACDLFDISKSTLFRLEHEGVTAKPPRDLQKLEALYTKKNNVDEIKKVIRVRKVIV